MTTQQEVADTLLEKIQATAKLVNTNGTVAHGQLLQLAQAYAAVSANLPTQSEGK